MDRCKHIHGEGSGALYICPNCKEKWCRYCERTQIDCPVCRKRGKSFSSFKSESLRESKKANNSSSGGRRFNYDPLPFLPSEDTILKWLFFFSIFGGILYSFFKYAAVSFLLSLPAVLLALVSYKLATYYYEKKVTQNRFSPMLFSALFFSVLPAYFIFTRVNFKSKLEAIIKNNFSYDSLEILVWGSLVNAAIVATWFYSNYQKSKEQKFEIEAEVLQSESTRDDDNVSPSDSGEVEWDSEDAFQILGLDESSSISDIKTSYKQMVSKYHPDKVSTLAPEFRKLAEDKTKILNWAYEECLKRKGA